MLCVGFVARKQGNASAIYYYITILTVGQRYGVNLCTYIVYLAKGLFPV